MPKSQTGLTPGQLQEVDALDKLVEEIKRVQDACKEYKLGDVFILQEWDKEDPNNTWVVKGHRDLPLKFKVVHISKQGIPYLRGLASNGHPIGDYVLPREATAARVLMVAGQLGVVTDVINTTYVSKFIPDPDQLDSILLQTEYNPVASLKEKNTLFNEINKHNKRVAIKTNDYAKVLDYLKNLKPGDKFWTSPDNVYVVQSVQKVGQEWELNALDKNQQLQSFNAGYFRWRRLYREQPRSYARESAL